MILERTGLAQRRSHNVDAAPSTSSAAAQSAAEKPLTCMIFFFASQMQRNVQTPDATDSRRLKRPGPPAPTHRLDTLLSKIAVHAAYSPLLSQFETYPVEIPVAPADARRTPKFSMDEMHDTMLLMKFRSRRAREEWIATREWQEFMEATEREGVFRRMPHARCASSLKGLMDPIDVLTA